MRHAVVLPTDASFETWRIKARALLAAEIAPAEVSWSNAMEPGLFEDRQQLEGSTASSRVPRQFVERARQVALHRDFGRFALLYRVLWRITHDEPRLFDIAVDADVVELDAMTKSVRRDLHKMKAFVRFKEVAALGDAAPWFIAWFEPEHYIVAEVAPFFVGRFTNMRFSIVTPDASMHWDQKELSFTPGGRKGDVPADDASEDLWRTYYANIFNPARLKLGAMRAEMPQKYWKNLPEASLIAGLSSTAARRSESMIEAPASEPNLRVPVAARADQTITSIPGPDSNQASILDLGMLKEEASHCRSCDLWRDATQTVFGEGPRNARVVLVGEQPGDQEDLAGHPLVGPAGQLLDRALLLAEVDRKQLYVTNAVKHFKFVVRGKRRLHQSPKTIEIETCSQWLEHELALIQPSLVVALGGTAASALLKRATPIKANRGRLLSFGVSKLLITVHPSYLLRLSDVATREQEEQLFITDLKLIATHLAAPHGDKQQ
jgi:DNA polymerase